MGQPLVKDDASDRWEGCSVSCTSVNQAHGKPGIEGRFFYERMLVRGGVFKVHDEPPRFVV